MATRGFDGPEAGQATVARPGGGLAPPSVRVLRPADLLSFTASWTGLTLVRGGETSPAGGIGRSRTPRLVAGSGGGLLTVRFAYQHTAEIASELDQTPPLPPVKARAANPSRLVFKVPAGAAVDYTVDGLLRAMRELEPAVAAVANPARSFTFMPMPRAEVSLTAGLIATAATAGVRRLELGGGVATSAVIAEGQRAMIAANRAIAGGVLSGRDILGPGGIIRPLPIPVPAPAPPRPVKPTAGETAIEAPFRLLLSPSSKGRWAHALTPVTYGAGRTELWHTRLAVAGKDGPDEIDTGQRIVRAIWTRDRDRKAGLAADPFVMLPTAGHRDHFVSQTAGMAGIKLAPEPVRVRRLALSSLGAWLDLHVRFPEGKEGDYPKGFGQLAAWDQISPMGRDQYVQVTTPGYLYPFGHRAYLIEITFRAINPVSPPVANLFIKRFITLGDPVVAYANRDLPFLDATVGPLRTPDLATPPNDTCFVPKVLATGQPLIWTVDGRDQDGETIHLTTPMVWVRQNKATAADLTAQMAAFPAALHDGDALIIDALGHTVAFAPALAGDQTTPGARGARASAEARSLVIGGDFGINTSVPRLVRADVVVPAIRHLAASAGPVTVRYPAAYKANGFNAGNAGNVFLELTDGPADLSFGTSERSGGFVRPDVKVGGLARSVGLVADVAQAATGGFDPKTLLDGAFPKLFGLFDLADLVETLSGGALNPLGHAPKFITEQLDRVAAVLHDLAEFKQAIEDAPAQIAGAATTLKADVAASVQAVQDSIAALLAAEEDAVASGNLEAALTALVGQIQAVADGLPATPLTPFARARLDRLVQALKPALALLEEADGLIAAIRSFVQGISPGGGEFRARMEWFPPLQNFPKTDPILSFDDPKKALRILVEARAATGHAPGLEVAAELSNFHLNLLPGAALMRLNFDRLAFRGGGARRPEVDLVFGGIEFVGVLGFVEVLKELVPLDGFSDPPFLDVSAEGVTAGFTISLPNVAIGVFSLSNLALAADARVPFLGESVSVGFSFCTRERPFTLAVFPLGGGGFVGIRLSPKGLTLLEASLEFGAVVALDFGVASGSVSAMGGIYIKLEGDAGSLTGYLRIRGEVDVLSLISASIELYLALTYAFDTGKMVGEASLTVHVEVLFFSTSVSIHTRRTFAGSNGDPTAADMLQLQGGVSAPWRDYWAAFAPAGA